MVPELCPRDWGKISRAREADSRCRAGASCNCWLRALLGRQSPPYRQMGRLDHGRVSPRPRCDRRRPACKARAAAREQHPNTVEEPGMEYPSRYISVCDQRLREQLKSLWELVTGDAKGAKETQEQFLDAWKNHPGQQISDLADNIPLVGNVLGVIHLAMGDTDGFWKSEEAATRTLLVMGAGALTVGTGGAAAPILAGVVAGIAADAAITGIESARHEKYDPQGYLGAISEFNSDWRSAAFDIVSLGVGDGWIGSDGAVMKAPAKTTKVIRVEGEGNYLTQRRLNRGEPPIYGDNRHLFPTVRDGMAHPEVVGLNPDRGVLFLTLDDISRSEAYYAQSLEQYRNAATVRYNRAREEVLLPAAFNFRIKSFRVLSNDPSLVPFHNAPSEHTPGRQDVFRVDEAVTDHSFGCRRAVYAPLIDAAMPGTFEEARPLWIEHLPNRVRELMRKNQVAYHNVRLFVVSSPTFSKLALKANIAQHITDQEWWRLQRNPIPLVLLNDAGIDQVEARNFPVRRLRQSREVKCGRSVTGDADHGQHTEYLAEFGDRTTGWVPSVNVDIGLKQEFWTAMMTNPREVSEVISTDSKAGTLTVRRTNGSIDIVPQEQIFWHEEATPTKITEEELQAMLYHWHYGPNKLSENILCSLYVNTDWAELEILDEGAAFTRNPSADAAEEYAQNDVHITTTKVQIGLREMYGISTIPLSIMSNGAPFRVRISHGRDATGSGDGCGMARLDVLSLGHQHITSFGEIYPPIQTRGLLVLDGTVTEASIAINTADTTIGLDPTVDQRIYDQVDFPAPDFIMRARRSTGSKTIIPFVINRLYDHIDFTLECIGAEDFFDPDDGDTSIADAILATDSNDTSLADAVLGTDSNDTLLADAIVAMVMFPKHTYVWTPGSSGMQSFSMQLVNARPPRVSLDR
ncbi:DUF3421 domain protein [Mycena venus]|uniref:DUF3421 domain protein n=1 Tax=Mycena venus TaxID=2733690 RepID=A0A8H6YHK1_9AGAR|nr:DUF3421 domain protein [Mycena venus]